MTEEFSRPYERTQTNRVMNQAQPASTAAQSNNFDDFQDDDLLCDVDVDQITSSAVTIPLNRSTESNRQHNESDILFDDDMDDNDFMLIESQLEEHHLPQNQDSANVDAVRNEPSVSVVAKPQQSESIADDKYRFKIRGINLATIKQLAACSSQDKIRRKHFLIKGEIYSIPSKCYIIWHSMSPAPIQSAIYSCLLHSNILLYFQRRSKFHVSVNGN